jgi:hypothetical protein
MISLPKTPCIHRIRVWFWPTLTVQGWPELYVHTVNDRTFGDFPAKNTVYIFGSGQL